MSRLGNQCENKDKKSPLQSDGFITNDFPHGVNVAIKHTNDGKFSLI